MSHEKSKDLATIAWNDISVCHGSHHALFFLMVIIIFFNIIALREKWNISFVLVFVNVFLTRYPSICLNPLKVLEFVTTT